MKNRTDHITRLIKDTICQLDLNAEVILFGSRARGDEKPDSDWDILILTTLPATIETERKFRDKLYDLELDLEEPFSLFVYSKNEWKESKSATPFHMAVDKDGILI
ncbi:MAG: nucleotidyltransferase domain-containing protein [Chlorobi bacterium]|nr:nucleotidyltransferase domain-containing protein [Chlorobiota bacterium]